MKSVVPPFVKLDLDLKKLVFIFLFPSLKTLIDHTLSDLDIGLVIRGDGLNYRDRPLY
ncbi:hypothetical protein HYC85_019022 [Camellia sinensis]|uniref:Uncharacterized protein n=1 Tax=Camellia sinensis TaxID=4442 RepID=A0A7J7GXF4_CAMSI|nr:hypothetical protein HYC85_019022 [Camellia sinensis]